MHCSLECVKRTAMLTARMLFEGPQPGSSLVVTGARMATVCVRATLVRPQHLSGGVESSFACGEARRAL